MYASPPADTHKDVRHVRLGKASLQLGRTSKREIATVGDSPLPGFVVHAGPPAKAVTHSGDVFVLLRVSLNRLRPAGHLVGSSFHRRSSRVDRFEQAVHIGYRDQGFTFTSVLSGGGWARWHCFLTSRVLSCALDCSCAVHAYTRGCIRNDLQWFSTRLLDQSRSPVAASAAAAAVTARIRSLNEGAFSHVNAPSPSSTVSTCSSTSASCTS